MTERPPTSRCQRQMLAEGFGRKTQERLDRARVTIVGLGAIGSRVAEDLARAGVGYLRLVDRDFVELSNLHRQHLYDEQDAADEQPKALASALRIERINSEITTDPRLEDLGPEIAGELLGDVDLWIDGTDNFQTRYVLNDFAVRERKPWIYGACVANQAMVAPFLPGRSCLRCMFPSPPPAETVQTCDTAGIIPPAAAYVAALQTALAIAILGRPDEPPGPRLFTADLRALDMRDIKLPDEPGKTCAACATREFPGLRVDAGTKAKRLCGRNAVQLSSASADFPDLRDVAKKLDGRYEYELSRHMLRVHIDEGQITVFRGGRAIVQGTEDPGRARALFDRYLGT